MARPRIPDEISPRADMLRAATRLLRQGGLAAAGINQIVAESGAPKGSLYHFFPDGKTQIAREALSAYRDAAVERYRARAQGCRSPEEAVRRILLREPTAEETAGFTAFTQKNGLASLCRVLFNGNEFLFID